MGIRIVVLTALLGFFLALPLPSQPVPPKAPFLVRMRTLRLRIRHPDPRYLSTQEAFYKTDELPRIYTGNLTVLPGRATWRPDASAQVDELNAQLVDEVRRVDP